MMCDKCFEVNGAHINGCPNSEDMQMLTCNCPRPGLTKMNCPVHGITIEPTLRPYNSAERNEMPIWDIIANYFPDAIASVARHSKKANDKHNPGEPLHWSRHKSSDHLNKAARHLMTPDAVDPDTKEIELAGAAWRCLAALQLREEKRLIALGIRPLSGVVE